MIRFTPILLLSTTFLVSKSSAQSISFRPLTAANGSMLCAVGISNSSESVGDILGIPAEVPDKLKCSYQCTELNTNSECSAFNYVINGPNDEQCQFYQYRPSRCVVSSPGCLYYEVSVSIIVECLYECIELCSYYGETFICFILVLILYVRPGVKAYRRLWQVILL